MKMDITKIRWLNARHLAAYRCGSKRAFAEKLRKSDAQVAHIIGQKPTRNIGHGIAKQITDAFEVGDGWLDIPHPEIWDEQAAADILDRDADKRGSKRGRKKKTTPPSTQQTQLGSSEEDLAQRLDEFLSSLPEEILPLGKRGKMRNIITATMKMEDGKVDSVVRFVDGIEQKNIKEVIEQPTSDKKQRMTGVVA